MRTELIDSRFARRWVAIDLSRCLLYDDAMITTTERLERWDDQLAKIQAVMGIGQLCCKVLIEYTKGNTKRMLWYLSGAVVTSYVLVKQPEWQERWEEKHQSS
jgi:hypothetical protein